MKAACGVIELSNRMYLKATYELIGLADCLCIKAACGLIAWTNYLCMQAPVPMGWLRAGAPAKCRHTVRAPTIKEEPNGSSQTVA